MVQNILNICYGLINVFMQLFSETSEVNKILKCFWNCKNKIKSEWIPWFKKTNKRTSNCNMPSVFKTSQSDLNLHSHSNDIIDIDYI